MINAVGSKVKEGFETLKATDSGGYEFVTLKIDSVEMVKSEFTE